MTYRSILVIAAALALPVAASAQAATAKAYDVQDIVNALAPAGAAATPAGSTGGAQPDGSIALDDSERGFSLSRPTAQHAPSAAPAKRVVHANAVDRQQSMLDMRLNFASGSYALDDSAREEAKKFALALNSPQLNGRRFAIEGHTDSVGNPDVNKALSGQRAQAVVDYMVGLGVERERLEAAGYGSTRPRPGLRGDNASNRRVEIVGRP